MHDALLNRTLRLTLVGTISLVALAALILSYHGLFELLWGNFAAAGFRLGWGFAAGAAALLLIRYRTDLIDT